MNGLQTRPTALSASITGQCQCVLGRPRVSIASSLGSCSDDPRQRPSGVSPPLVDVIKKGARPPQRRWRRLQRHLSARLSDRASKIYVVTRDERAIGVCVWASRRLVWDDSTSRLTVFFCVNCSCDEATSARVRPQDSTHSLLSSIVDEFGRVLRASSHVAASTQDGRQASSRRLLQRAARQKARRRSMSIVSTSVQQCE